MKVKVNFDYWYTLYEYFNKDEFKLNGDIIHDARIIKRVQYLWQNASEKYINELNKKDLMDLWCDIDSLSNNQNYKALYREFVDCLHYASDRMNLNRWTYLRLCISKVDTLIYSKYCDIYKHISWSDAICGGYVYNRDYTSCKTNLELSCEKEWENLIGKEIKNQK